MKCLSRVRSKSQARFLGEGDGSNAIPLPGKARLEAWRSTRRYARQPIPDQADTDPLNLDNIKAQRQLTDEGRNQAKALGAALRQLKIPVGKILASKFYRARETAELLDLGAVEAVLDITEGGLVVSPSENQRRAAALRTLLWTVPPEGKNTIIVSHRPNLQDAAGKEFGDLGEGEIVVFQPLGGGKFKLVARVAPSSRWTEWAR